jgi:sugar O-acyltransferase (sialic acid O-acetyltransferase NeuD family)
VSDKIDKTLSTANAIIYGGGGHAATIGDLLLSYGYNVVGCIDDDVEKNGSLVLPGLKVIGTREDLVEVIQNEEIEIGVLGIGGVIDSGPRIQAYQLIKKLGLKLPTLIHPSSIISTSVTLGEATVVLAGVVIGPRCKIGTNVIINQGAQICHDVIIKDHVHIAPGAVIAGGCVIEESTVVGMGSCIKQGLTIKNNSIVGMGAIVTKSIAKPDCLVFGNPAKIIK